MISRTGFAAAAARELPVGESDSARGGAGSGELRPTPAALVSATPSRTTATCSPGLTSSSPPASPDTRCGCRCSEGRRGVVAGDILLNEAEAMLIRQRLGKSGIAFLFNDDDRIIAHPQMADLMSARPAGDGELPQIETVSLPGLSQAIRTWRGGGAAQQFFDDNDGRTLSGGLREDPDRGRRQHPPGGRRPARRVLFRDHLRAAAAVHRRDAVRRGDAADRALDRLDPGALAAQSRACRPTASSGSSWRIARGSIRSIREIDDLGRSVSTMRTVVRTFSSFVPKRLVQQLVASGTPIAARRHAARDHGAVHRRRRLHRQDREGRSDRRHDLHVALFRGHVGDDHGPPGHGRQIHRRRGDGDLERAGRRSRTTFVNACAAVLACTRRNAH